MQAVFFDLDGTLVELPDDFLALFETAMDDCGVSPEVEHAEFYTEEFFDYLADCHPEPYRMAMAALREEYDLAPSAETLAEAYTEREAEMTTLRPGVRDALDALDSTNSALGVLTNGGARAQHRKLAHHGIEDHFEEVVVSGDAGVGKPDPEIFAAATEAIPADEYVFVADDLERDVLPAQRAGFTGVLLVDEGEDNADEDNAESSNAGEADMGLSDAEEVDETVSSLREVPDLLG